MGKVTESIFDGVTAVIPLAEVGYVSKFKNCMVIHFNSGVELTLIPPEQNAFLAAWCKYRSELESNTLMDFEGAQPAPSVPMDVIVDYLVSISAHLARRDDAKAQAEIGELLKMIASAPKPGASVPEDVMRDAERYRYLRARDDGTAGVGCWIEADGRVCDRGWLYGVQLDSAIDSFIEVLAAAPKPEAKP